MAETNQGDKEWDRRVSFYPNAGYALDDICKTKYYDQMQNEEDFINEDQDTNSDKTDNEEVERSCEEAPNNCELTEKIINDPPIFNRADYQHPLRSSDWDFFLFNSSSGALRQNSMAELAAKMSGSHSTTGRQKIPNETLKLIKQNRQDCPLVKVGLKYMFCLEVRIAGLQKYAPIRTVQVPGKLPLAAFFDRVLCPFLKLEHLLL